jgi:hypothetical protein
MAIEHTVRASEGNDWISIENCVTDLELETLSRALSTTAVTVYAVDEKLLQFSFVHFEDGRMVRALEYADDGDQGKKGRWTKVQGEPESWEVSLFSAKLMEQYAEYAPDEVGEARSQSRIRSGFSIPWACNAHTAAEIARAFELPWDPLAPNRFPPASDTELIPGSPDRWNAFLRERRKPWWKFW